MPRKDSPAVAFPPPSSPPQTPSQTPPQPRPPASPALGAIATSAPAPPSDPTEREAAREEQIEKAPPHPIAHRLPGWQALVWPPLPMGPPQGANQMEPPPPLGTKATHFSGPLVSGGIPQGPNWAPAGLPQPLPPIGGTPLLSTVLAVDFSMGNFTVPVQFPSDSLIVGVAAFTAIAFPAVPSFQLGTLTGAADIVAATAFPAPGAPIDFTAAAGQLPVWEAAVGTPFVAFLTVTGNTGTAGLGLILVQFVRVPQQWT